MSARPNRLGAVLDDGLDLGRGLAGIRPERRKLTGEMPASDYDDLADWAHASGASKIALVVHALRVVRADPDLRLAVERAAEAYARANRAR